MVLTKVDIYGLWIDRYRIYLTGLKRMYCSLGYYPLTVTTMLSSLSNPGLRNTPRTGKGVPVVTTPRIIVRKFSLTSSFPLKVIGRGRTVLSFEGVFEGSCKVKHRVISVDTEYRYRATFPQNLPITNRKSPRVTMTYIFVR